MKQHKKKRSRWKAREKKTRWAGREENFIWGHRYARKVENKYLILFYLYGTIYCTERGCIFYVSCQLFYYPKRFEKLL